MKLFYILIIFFMCLPCFSQQPLKPDPYRKADSIALAFPRNKYYFYTETAEELTQDLTTQAEKCRAIFRWITNNIKYDFETLNNKEGQDPEVVYKRRKAVCAGYANLFKAMCNDAKLDCRIISGFAGGTTGNDHAWNIVKLDGTWYIMDATWASGYSANAITGKFKKAYDNTYWMADYNTFKKSHQSEDGDWMRYIAGKPTED